MHQTEPPSPCVRPISSHGAPLSSSYLPAYSHAAVFVLLVIAWYLDVALHWPYEALSDGGSKGGGNAGRSDGGGSGVSWITPSLELLVVAVVMVAPMLLVTVLVHELGHVWAARWLGGECEEVGRPCIRQRRLGGEAPLLRRRDVLGCVPRPCLKPLPPAACR